MKSGVLLFSLLFCSAFAAAQEGNSLREWISGHTGNVLICGHRGGFEGTLPENSLSRFKKTASRFKKSAVMLELDVRQSTDGELYVLHDDTLERTTNGKGLIRNAHSAYLDSLYLKTQQGLPTQERLPRLEAILDWAAGRQNIFLMIDVKADVWEKTPRSRQALPGVYYHGGFAPDSVIQQGQSPIDSTHQAEPGASGDGLFWVG